MQRLDVRRDAIPGGVPTRRNLLSHDGAVSGGGLLAGCTNDGDGPASSSGPHPEIPEDEQLFDRQRVSDVIINGEF